jgi:hypothetical protein
VLVKHVLAVLIAVAVLLAVWLSGIGRRSAPGEVGSRSVVAGNRDPHDAVDAPIAAVNGVSAERSSLAAPVSSMPPPTAVSSDRITVRSSIGLELPFAEFEHHVGEWTQAALVQGTCSRSVLVGVTHASAPGHAAVAVTPDAKEIVLEPDALLVIEADSLRACARVIEPLDQFTDHSSGQVLLRPGLRRAVAWGWLSDEQWAIALAPGLLEEGYDQACELEIHWRDERTTHATFRGLPGCREHWTVDCEQRVSGLPLEVRIERPVGLAAGPVSLALDRATSGSLVGKSSKFSWGEVHEWADDEFHELRSIEPASRGIVLGFVPSGARMNLSARDESSGAYGRLAFVHDGSPRVIELVPPFRLTGRLVPPVGAVLPSHLDISCTALEGQEEIAHWDMGRQSVPVEPSGAFVLFGPGHLLRLERVPLEVPSRLVLSLNVPGFDPWAGSFETHHAAALDCGDVHLETHPAEVVLAPGHGLVVRSVKWESLMTAGEKQVTWNVRDAVLRDDGCLAIFLERDSSDPRLLSTWPTGARSWPTPPPQALLIYTIADDDSGLKAFERDAGGRYAESPVKTREIDFDFREPIDRARWLVGWEWRGLTGVSEAIDPSRFGEMVHVRVRAPALGVTLQWATDWEHRLDPGARGGSAPIDGVLGPIVLR